MFELIWTEQDLDVMPHSRALEVADAASYTSALLAVARVQAARTADRIAVTRRSECVELGEMRAKVAMLETGQEAADTKNGELQQRLNETEEERDVLRARVGEQSGNIENLHKQITQLRRQVADLKAGAAPPYDRSFARLRDIVDEAFGMQAAMGNSELLTFLDKAIFEMRIAKWPENAVEQIGHVLEGLSTSGYTANDITSFAEQCVAVLTPKRAAGEMPTTQLSYAKKVEDLAKRVGLLEKSFAEAVRVAGESR